MTDLELVLFVALAGVEAVVSIPVAGAVVISVTGAASGIGGKTVRLPRDNSPDSTTACGSGAWIAVTGAALLSKGISRPANVLDLTATAGFFDADLLAVFFALGFAAVDFDFGLTVFFFASIRS